MISNWKITPLILVFGLTHNLTAQDSKIGIVQFLKYSDTDDKFTQSTTDSTIAYFNKRKHSILITNKKDSTKLKTNNRGIFKIPEKYFDYCSITINPGIKHLSEEFLFMEGLGKKDSITFKVYDYHISNQIDSTRAPDFYNKFNTNKAEKDFFDGNKRYLLGIGITYSNKFMENLESKSKEFGFKIEYPEKMVGTLSEQRVIYRYNNRMRELLGIKSWW
jgi:hypothetical protein